MNAGDRSWRERVVRTHGRAERRGTARGRGEGDGREPAGGGEPEPSLLQPGDGWSQAVARSKPVTKVLGGPHGAWLEAILNRPAGAPNALADKHWCGQLDALAATEKSIPKAVRELLSALAEATPAAGAGVAVALLVAGSTGAEPADAVVADAVTVNAAAVDAVTSVTDARPLLVSRPNSTAAVHTLWSAVRLLGPEAVPRLGMVLSRLTDEPWTADQTSTIRNACAAALAALGTEEAIEELRSTVPRAQTKAQRELLLLYIARSPWASAKRSKVAEVTVPTHGLDVAGTCVLTTHHRQYAITLHADGDVTSKTLEDAAVVQHEAAERVVSAELRAIKATYRKEVDRIEALLATDRTWTPAQWRRLYSDHPITRAVAARLVWRLELDGATADVIPAVNWPTGDVQIRKVRLWHPIDATPDELASWRALLTSAPFGRDLEQPFQQIERQFTSGAGYADRTELDQQTGAVAVASSWEAALTRVRWTVISKAGGKNADRGDFIHREFPDEKVTAIAMFTRLPAAPAPSPTSAASPRTSADAVPARIRLGAAWIHRTEDKTLTPLPLDALPPRLCSEVERDLAVLMSAPTDAVVAPNAVPPSQISDKLP